MHLHFHSGYKNNFIRAQHSSAGLLICCD